MKVDRTKETNIANNGMKMTVIAYRKSNDIDIQFENNVIVKNKSYYAFKNGNIKCPAQTGLEHKCVGEINIAKCGLKMEITHYYGYKNITVKFEDGVVVTNQRYENFKSGKIKHHDKCKKERKDETSISSKGEKMTIIRYGNSKDIDVKFTDGTVVKNKDYRSFKRGTIRNPNKKK